MKDNYLCKKIRKFYDTFLINIIMENQPKFAIVVHDDNFDMLSIPEETLNLIEDDNLHEYIPVDKTDIPNQ